MYTNWKRSEMVVKSLIMKYYLYIVQFLVDHLKLNYTIIFCWRVLIDRINFSISGPLKTTKISVSHLCLIRRGVTSQVCIFVNNGQMQCIVSLGNFTCKLRRRVIKIQSNIIVRRWTLYMMYCYCRFIRARRTYLRVYYEQPAWSIDRKCKRGKNTIIIK